jgi:hypothetical protein
MREIIPFNLGSWYEENGVRKRDVLPVYEILEGVLSDGCIDRKTEHVFESKELADAAIKKATE